jgi:hypothetical protein
MYHAEIISTAAPDRALIERHQAILQRAAYRSLDAARDWTSVLAARFGLPRLPAAALAMLPGDASTALDESSSMWVFGQTHPHRDTNTVLLAEPIHLRVQNDGLTMIGLAAAPVTTAEAHAIVATLNRHFAPDGVRFGVLSDSCWLLLVDRPVHVDTTPSCMLDGRAVFEHQPRGEHAPLLRQIMNEAQMLLHEHPINLARANQGVLGVSGIWLWGEGALPECSHRHWQQVYGHDCLAAGIAAWVGATYAPGWDNAAPAGDVLILDTQEPSATATLDGLLESVRDGHFATLHWRHITAQGGHEWRYRRTDRWRFWRHSTSTLAFFQAAA